MATGCLRDEIICALNAPPIGLSSWQICRLALDQMTIAPETGHVLIRARRQFALGSALVALPERLCILIEQYVNLETSPAQQQGRPFLDWRPEIGMFLFPSASTGQHISYNAVKRILNKPAIRAAPPEAEGHPPDAPA
jgi:hypothetical protein